MAKYQGKTVKLNTPMRGDVKKFKVFERSKRTKEFKCGILEFAGMAKGL